MINLGRIRPSWNCEAMLVRGRLSDKKIEQYRKRGFYSAEWQKARKEYWERKEARRRSGNFDQTTDGRLIYNPL